jgi:hypothetical protein
MTDIDINRNIIYLTGDITEDTVSYFISRVNYLVEENKDREISLSEFLWWRYVFSIWNN